MYNSIVQFRIKPEVKTDLEALAAKSGVSVSDIIRACITRALPYVKDRIESQLARVNDQP